MASNSIGTSNDDDLQESSLQTIKLDECRYRNVDFDPTKHKLLNSELKKFYTAVTRARVNIWIFDEDIKKRAPMFDFLLKKNLAVIGDFHENITEIKQRKNDIFDKCFPTKSTKEEWETKASSFFNDREWKLALKCSRKAKNKVLEMRCLAKIEYVLANEKANRYYHQQGSESLSMVRASYIQCALSLLGCGLIEDAEIALRNANARYFLALLFEKHGKVITFFFLNLGVSNFQCCSKWFKMYD